MKNDDPIDMYELAEDEDDSACKHINSAMLETDDPMGTNSDSNQNDDGMMDFDYNTNPEVCIISIGMDIVFTN
uniref:CPXV159 protein n=1 Tax=Elaeophora elaphi TaxID=1147741 RepID=A0A0R3RII5_9BILA